MAAKRSVRDPEFFEEIAPGGKYFGYALAVLILLGLVFLTLITMLVLPRLTGGRYQNPVSEQFLGQLPTPASPTPVPVVTPVPTACPNPNYEVPSGKQVYQWSHGPEVVGPKIQSSTVDPLDAKVGQKQTITIVVKNDSPVTSAAATLTTDGSPQTVNFKLTQGSATDGTWELSWQMNGTYKCRYGIEFDLKSPTGEFDETQHIK